MDELLSPRQVARAIGVSESSLKRWCDQGLLSMVRTAGGHRRIRVAEVLRFTRQQNHELVEPAILNMPSCERRRDSNLEERSGQLAELWLRGDEGGGRAIVLDLFASGRSLPEICDRVLAPAFWKIGEQWECQEANVYQERNSCQCALRTLHEIRRLLPEPAGPEALGATFSGDQYTLAPTMAELVLRAAGWHASLLGMSIPVDSMIEAIRDRKPRCFFSSVSYLTDENRFAEDFARLADVCAAQGVALVVGGQALTLELRKQLQYAACCETFSQLHSFAQTIHPLASLRAAEPADTQRGPASDAR